MNSLLLALKYEFLFVAEFPVELGRGVAPRLASGVAAARLPPGVDARLRQYPGHDAYCGGGNQGPDDRVHVVPRGEISGLGNNFTLKNPAKPTRVLQCRHGQRRRLPSALHSIDTWSSSPPASISVALTQESYRTLSSHHATRCVMLTPASMLISINHERRVADRLAMRAEDLVRGLAHFHERPPANRRDHCVGRGGCRRGSRLRFRGLSRTSKSHPLTASFLRRLRTDLWSANDL